VEIDKCGKAVNNPRVKLAGQESWLLSWAASADNRRLPLYEAAKDTLGAGMSQRLSKRNKKQETHHAF